jgi:acetylornithine deacetylase/succinyl-diaminopimelate desuccinylase-like protein
MPTPQEYAQTNAPRFEQELIELLKIPSVSTDPARASDVQRAGAWLVTEMTRIGFPSVELIQTAGHPIVYGEWLSAGESAPTVLIYGHYDVQPAEMVDGWHNDPFQPVIKDNVLYARGSTDDKGQIMAHLKAIESLIETESALPVNLKVIFEGEEEVSSLHLGEFVTQYKDRLKSDVCIISDSAIVDADQPSIVYALRGLTYMELHVQGPATDLHSGAFGGTVHNPAQAIAEIIAALHHPDGSIAVPGFYDSVRALPDEEREALSKLPWTVENWSKATGITTPWGEEQFSLKERIGARPTLEINGLYSGFIGEGAKTVLPAYAMAKISCRLVADQDPKQIYQLVRDHIAAITPPTVRSELKLLHVGDAAITELNSIGIQAAIEAYTEGWNKAPVFIRGGGSIPIVANFQRDLGIPVVLMGFGLETDGAHGPNEHFSLDLYHKGIAALTNFHKTYARLHAQA